MSFILLYVIFGVIVCCLSLYFIKSSPKGWEDSDGFHYGTLPENEIQHTQVVKTKPASELGYKLRQV